MKQYRLKASINTPHIEGSIPNGTIHISGRCCPEDCVQFFHPFINWMKVFQLTESKSIEVSFNLEYVNTSSALVLLRILRVVKNMNKNHDVTITWHHASDDKDMREVGKDLHYILGDIIQLETKVSKAS